VNDTGTALSAADRADLEIDALAIWANVQRHAISDVKHPHVVSNDVSGAGVADAVAAGGLSEDQIHGCIPYIMEDTNPWCKNKLSRHFGHTPGILGRLVGRMIARPGGVLAMG
jgi:hypothetical protein